MSREIYLDHGATTPILKEAKDAMEPYLTKEYGNASTSYELGERAKAAIESSRRVIASCMGASPEEIFFTSGGSESDNWGIKGIAGMKKQQGNHIITTKIEHHAILHSCKYLEGLGYRVTYLPVNEEGIVSVKQLEKEIGKGTTLISVMFGNNEIGTIEPIVSIGRLAREHGVLFHTDAVQAVGHFPIRLSEMPIDLLSASAHKFGGPKGIGFLYVAKGVPIPSYIHGGAQEKGKRAGTENVAGIVGMGKALEIMTSNMRKNMMHEKALRNYLIERVLHEVPGAKLNGSRYQRLPGNVNFSFKGVEGTALKVLLEEDGICASVGSACNTGQSRVSHVIEAIGVEEDYAPGTMRFSLGYENTREEIDFLVECLKQYVPILAGD